MAMINLEIYGLVMPNVEMKCVVSWLLSYII